MSVFGAGLALAAAFQAGPIDWAALPPLPYRQPPQLTQSMHGFALREVRLRRCPMPRGTAGVQSLTVEVAVLIDGGGAVRVTVPRAINCPTVEQYAAGLVASFARNNLLPLSGGSEQWYRASVTFAWRR